MKLKNVDPFSPEVTARVLERIRRMTPEEALAFLNYRTPGIEETDMTGMYSHPADLAPAPCYNCTRSSDAWQTGARDAEGPLLPPHHRTLSLRHYAPRSSRSSRSACNRDCSASVRVRLAGIRPFACSKPGTSA